MAKIPGGYILLARKITDGDIWDKPPLYIKVWVYLLTRAQHATYKELEKGQLFVTIPDIQQACSWHVGYRKVVPTKDQIYQILEWLRKPRETHTEADTQATMIATTKATHGMVVTVLNYCVYQNPNLYEGNDESNDEKVTKPTREQRPPNNINKNDNKNDKNYKNDIDIYVEIMNAFNQICCSLPKVRAMTKTRKSHINQRFKDWTIEQIMEFFERVEKSSVLTGKKYDWHADFDWILKEANFTKIIEGNYDGGGNKNGASGQYRANNRSAPKAGTRPSETDWSKEPRDWQ